MIKIEPSGDYVQLKYTDTVSEYVQEELKSDSDAIEYSSSSNGRIYLKFGRMTFEYSDPTEFEINGSAVTDAADFITKFTALFSSPGGGVTIYTGDGSLTGDRTIEANGHIFQIEDENEKYNLKIDPTAKEINIAMFDGSSYSNISMVAIAGNTLQTQINAFNGTKRATVVVNAIDLNVKLQADNGFSSDDTNFYIWNGVEDSTATPNKRISVRINGENYYIPVELPT